VTTFSGAVLTGGASTRMGSDKALLRVGDRTLAAVAADALGGAGATEVFCVGGDLDGLRALGLEARPDDHPGEGPLGGVITALGLAREEVVVVLTCDLPAIDPASVRTLVDALAADPDAQVAAPVADGRVYPITAAYRRSARPGLARSFQSGERAVRRALADMAVHPVVGLDLARFDDVDRPEDLHRYARPRDRS
jgi:molybdenum cofactor guanylyltransferase